MNNENNEILSHRRMEELLPDYVFDRIDDDNREAFERSIGHYPDIEKEVREARAVFARVERMDIDGMFSRRSRNMSVKVQRRIEDKRRRQPNTGIFFRYIMPTAALILIAVMAINTGNPFGEDSPEEQIAELPPLEIIKPGETLALVDTAVGYTELAAETGLTDPQFDSALLQENSALDESDLTGLDDAINEYIASLTVKSDDAAVAFESFSYDELNNLSEDDFQKIIEELENADFNS